MDAVGERYIEQGDGTPERQWRQWLRARRLARQAPATLVGPAQRAVVVAPHPDDEVLMVGGLLAQLGTLQRPMLTVAVTDGEGSHPGSTLWPPERLAHRRQQETHQALALLGCPQQVLRARIPDGFVAAQQERLAQLLARVLSPADVVFTTWRLDGHPDHEATARATRTAAAAVGCRAYEVPVWGWHWAPAGAAQMPWAAASVITLSRQAVRRKCAALQSFASQWESDARCAATPVLRPSMLQRARRPFELVFG